MKIKNFVAWMESRKEPQGEYSIENARNLLINLGSPQNKIKIVHVAGTNGKGSTCSYISNALIESGLSVGLFTSPYIEDINESIKINGEKISDQDFVSIGEKVRIACQKAEEDGYYPTYFDILTSLAYIYFFEQAVDLAVIEVGMGGRMDSTNVMDFPLASVITSISLDHTNFLGDSLGKIAYEKAGIIKEGIPVFCYDLEKAAREVVEKECQEKKTKASYIDKQEVDILKINEGESKFLYKSREYEIGLSGRHQVYNAILSIEVLNFLKKYFNIGEDHIRKGLKRAKNIARLETISRNPHVILDGSHNLEGIIALKDFIKRLDYEKLILGFSVLGDKDYVHIVDELFPLADKIVITEIENDRSLPLEELKKISEKFNRELIVEKDNIEAFKKSLSLVNGKDILLWCGSLYLMKNIREAAMNFAGKL